MHTEHVRNLHPGWVLGGWLLAVAVTSVVFMVGVGLGLIGPERPSSGFLVPVTVAAGFFLGGLFVGTRWADAPVLHGVAITLLSVVVWFLGNLLAPGRVAGEALGLESPSFILGMILLQLVATVGGAWSGRRLVLRGGVGPDEGREGP